MKKELLLLTVIMIAVAGCVGGAPAEEPETPASPAVTTPTTTPTEPTAPATPPATPPEPEQPAAPAKTMPSTHECMDLLNAADMSWSSVVDTHECFTDANKAYECAYLLTKMGRDLEIEQKNIDIWVVRLYGGAYNCAKTIPDDMPIVTTKHNGDDEPGHLTLLNYYQWFNDDNVVQGTTEEELDSLIMAMNNNYA